MKKFRITDEDGAIYEVEATEEEKNPEVVDEDKTKCGDEEGLAPEEIDALKRLASYADKLIALITKTDSKDEDEEVKDEDEEVKDDEGEEDEEKVIDTDEEVKEKTKDSKDSFGSLLSKKKTDDSRTIDSALDIESAWIKIYGGK